MLKVTNPFIEDLLSAFFVQWFSLISVLHANLSGSSS